jgi:glucosamine-6-phosphate isomerase
MNQIIYKDYSELSLKSAEQIAALIVDKPDAMLCFPAGETPVGTFKHLIEMNRRGEVSFKQCKIVGLDEWTNLGKRSSENCLNYLKKEFFNHIDYKEENLCFFDGESTDLERECRKTDEFIRKYGPIDMILLGVGMNGHLGLNEPGASFDLYSHVVNLDEITKNVGQKYFREEVELKSGISLGPKSIREARTVIVQLSGIKKAKIAKRLIDSDISPDFPASIIKLHSNAYLLMDQEASKYL